MRRRMDQHVRKLAAVERDNALAVLDELLPDDPDVGEALHAARLGQMARMPTSNELPKGAPALPRIPSTGEEVFEMALRDAKRLVVKYWRQSRP